MALTPEDVRNKLFTTVRLREGYEQTEVDEFLDEVEAELTRLLEEHDKLRSTAGQPGIDGRAGRTPTPAKPPATTESPTAPPARVAPQEIVVRTSADVGSAAAKILEMAQRTADQYLDEARAEADQLVAAARSAAEQLSVEATTKADEVDRQTHERTTALEHDLEEKRSSALSGLQEEKRRLESEIETLRSFEREYRGRLRTFLENQLEQLSPDASGDTPLAPPGGPVSPPVDASAAASPDTAAGATDGAGAAGIAAESAGVASTDTVSEARDSDTVSEARDSGAEPSKPSSPAVAGTATDRPTPTDSDDAKSTLENRPRSALGRILAEEDGRTDDHS